MTLGLVPPDFAARVGAYPSDGYLPGRDWVEALPGLLADLLDEWGLEPAGATLTGSCSVALPVRPRGRGGDGPDRGGAVAAGCSAGPEAGVGDAVLKVTWPHPEAAGEALALQAWDGNGAVRLLRADPRRFALLLERLHPRDLTTVDIDTACEVLGDLLATLRRPAHARVPTLAAYADRQATELRAAAPVIPRRYLDQASRLAGELASESAGPRWLLHTDLHYGNVLAADRCPWLAIDPKPMAGDVAFEVAPALANRADALGTGSTVRWALRRRLAMICERAGIDEDRARAWTIVREADTAVDLAAHPSGRGRTSLAVMIIKAMND